MHNKITRIGLDFEYMNSANPYLRREPAIVVNRGGYWGDPKRYRVTPMRLRWVQAITSKSGFVKDDGAGRAMWYHNIDPMYYGFKFESEFVTLEVLPDLRLKITLNDDGREYIDNARNNWTDLDVQRYYKGMDWDTASEEDKEIARSCYVDGCIETDLEYEMLEDALCNGWNLDPNDDGRYFITYDAGIMVEAELLDELDYQPGDLGWSYNFYAIRAYTETLREKGYVIFDPYYFGETSLEDQRGLSVSNYE